MIVAYDFSLTSFKFKRSILPLLTNTRPNLKTIFHIKLKFLLRTKPLENLLLAKYLFAAALNRADAHVLNKAQF